MKKIKVEPKAEKWAERNSWFGKHKGLTYLAFDTHEELIDLGISPRSKLYYNLIDMVMHLFLSKNAKLKRNYSRKKTIQLTPEQVEIARKLKVPLKEYTTELRRKRWGGG